MFPNLPIRTTNTMLAIFGIGMTELIVLAIVLGILVVPVVAIVIVAVVVAGKSRRN